MEEVRAGRVPPGDAGTVGWAMLVKQMPDTLAINQAVGIIEPARESGVVILRAQRFIAEHARIHGKSFGFVALSEAVHRDAAEGGLIIDADLRLPVFEIAHVPGAPVHGLGGIFDFSGTRGAHNLAIHEQLNAEA